jgi:arabinofuranan 3-O-arabinosyltransferase
VLVSAGRRRAAGKAILPALVAAAYVLAFVQRTGLNTSDTKVDLHVDPTRFLAQVASVWSPTASLGHVQGGQYSGYLWPMGPFFALGHLLGVSSSVTERLWLGTLLALAAWGAVRLTDTLLERRRGAGHAVAGAAYMLNPYVVVFTSRTTVFLLAYAALPWLLVIVHRALREPARWWWAAAFGLVITSTAGGVNATVTALILLGPMLLAGFETLSGAVTPRAVLRFGWRALVATVAASIWWIVPLLVQSAYGLNFLQFTEQVGSIWATTSLTESLRLMGYWPSYLGVGYSDRLTPYFGDSPTLLFNPAVIMATVAFPALALGSYAWTRRWRYAPFLLACALVGLLVMSIGYPDGTPGRRAATFLYNHFSAFQFLRTTYKAGPLVALAVALFAAGATRALWASGRAPVRALLTCSIAALLVLGALPFFEGRALELTWSSIPSAWRQAGRDLNSQLPANSRAAVLPAQAFGFYNWGGTVDPILPALTKRPVAIRNVPPYDDLHAVDYLWTVDGLIQQQRLLPHELRPLLDLMSARAVITATDDDAARSGAMPPAAAAAELLGQPGFMRPARAYGPVHTFPSAPETVDPAQRLPEVRRYDLAARGLIRTEPLREATIVDGSAEGIADLAALGLISDTQPLFYAGDLSAAEIRAQALAGAGVFITDSNRRRAFVASRIRQNVGSTIPASEAFSADAAVLDPFPHAGSTAQTVATFEGARYVTAPYNPDIAEFPEHAPIAAFDGNPGTSWLADPTLDDSRHWIEIGFDHPRNVTHIDLLEDQSDPLVHLDQVRVNGRPFPIHRGWNRLNVGLRGATAIRVAITAVHGPGSNSRSVGGIAEIRIPGVSVRELLRPPLLAEQALRSTDLSHTTLTYVFERTTADQPLQRGPAQAQMLIHGDRLQAEASLTRLAQDPEQGIARVIDPPAARRWRISGLATVSPAAPDTAIDRVAGTRTDGSSFNSSGRLEGRPGYRASAAFDGSPRTAWVAPLSDQQPAWIVWRTPQTHVLRRLVLTHSALPARFPTLVSLSADGGPAVMSTVGSGGSVVLLRPLRGRTFKLTVLRAAGSNRPSVALAGIAGAGIPTATNPPGGTAIRGRCGELTASIAGQRAPLMARGSVAALDQGQPLPLTLCGAPVDVPATETDVTVAPALFRPLLVALRSRAPDPFARTAVASHRGVTDSGHQVSGSYTGVQVRVTEPSWLVLGESFNRGWRATCNGRSLGLPMVIDGFANGWRITPSCRSVSLSFAPQTFVSAGLVAGALACAVLLLVLILRRPRSQPAPPPTDLPADKADLSTRPLALPRALAVGALSAAAFGFVFGLRAGVVIGPAFALILWRGIATRTLSLCAGTLLVGVPVLYVLFPGQDQGGYDNRFATEHLGAHWVAVGAFALLTLVLARDLWVSRATRRPPAGQAAPPVGAAGPGSPS